jgi:hypothetical protein
MVNHKKKGPGGPIMTDPGYEIPARAPNETADHYLNRVTEETRIRAMAIKEAGRIERRIRSNVERVIIERAVRDAMKRPRNRQDRSRWYSVPNRPGPFFIFAPLFILLYLIFQDITKTDKRFKKGAAISRGDLNE